MRDEVRDGDRVRRELLGGVKAARVMRPNVELASIPAGGDVDRLPLRVGRSAVVNVDARRRAAHLRAVDAEIRGPQAPSTKVFLRAHSRPRPDAWAGAFGMSAAQDPLRLMKDGVGSQVHAEAADQQRRDDDGSTIKSTLLDRTDGGGAAPPPAVVLLHCFP